MRLRLILSCLLLCSLVANSQIQISGSVKDSTGKPINGASVSLLNKKGLILSFAITPPTGLFQLKYQASAPDSFQVRVTAMGFVQQTKPVTSNSEEIAFRLDHGKLLLPDVLVVSKPILRRSGDTLNYDVSAFSDKQDRVIGDVIKKLPGIEVDEQGKIFYGGKPINRFYIDNDNLLDGRYNIATKSIPTDMVSKVQVLENHQPAKVLKDLVQSDQAALNIVLTDKARIKLIGTGDAALGTPHLYNAGINVMAFKKKFKFINFGKLNNTAQDLGDDIQNFFSPEATPPASLMQASSAGMPDISKRRSLFNHAGLITANNLLNLGKDLQFRINANYLQDKQFQAYRYNAIYYLTGDTIRYNEQLTNHRSYNTFNTQFTLTANRDDYFLNNTTILENAPEQSNASLVATGNGAVDQRLSGVRTNIMNRFNLIKKKGKHTYEIFSLLNYANNPSTLRVEPGLFETQFNNAMPYAGLEQLAAIPTFYTDNYLSFGSPNTTIRQQYRIGIRYQDQDLNSQLFREQLSGNKELVADSFANKLQWQRTTWYAQADYSYSKDRWVLSMTVPVQYLHTRYTGRQIYRNQHNFPVTPKFNSRYKLGKEDFLEMGYGYGANWGNITDVYDAYIMRNYRDFFANGSLLNEVRSHNVSIGYDLRKSIRIFFFSAKAGYSITDRNTISDQQISTVIQQSRLIAFNNRYKNYSFISAISKYIFPLLTTIGGKFIWNKSTTNQFQNSELLGIQHTSWTLSWNSNSKIGSWLNLGYKGTYMNSSSSFADNSKRTTTPAVQKWLHTADAAMTFGKKITAKLVADNYTYLLPGAQDVRVTFADVYVTWYMDKLKSNIEFSLTNIMGTDSYTNIHLTANSIMETMYTIRPRMMLVKFYYRF